MEGIYLYGIVGFPPELPREILGPGGNPVRLLPRGEVAAIVSACPLRPWPLDEAHLTLHETVVEEVMNLRPILPVRFNTLFTTEEAVAAILDERAQVSRSDLERVAGKAEMGLRVLWEPPCDAQWSASQDTREGGLGTKYLYRRLGEERRRAGLRAAGRRLIHEVRARLHSLAVESRFRAFPTDRLLFSGAYLVYREQAEAFRDGVAKARGEFPRLSFLLTGPWPPYHFVSASHDETGETLGT